MMRGILGPGLVNFGRVPARIPREEGLQLVDPHYQQVFDVVATPQEKAFVSEYTRSLYTVEGHMESISKYAAPRTAEPQDEHWNRVKTEVLIEAKNQDKVGAISFETGFDRVNYDQTTSAGYGYQGPKGPPGGTNHKRAKRIAAGTVYDFARKIALLGLFAASAFMVINSTPDLSFVRTQLSKLTTPKIRNVFGSAFHYVLLECLFVQPLIAAFMAATTFYYIGRNPRDDVSRLIRSVFATAESAMVIDWSAFDATVQLWEIDLAFRYIREMLTFPTPLTEVAFILCWILFKYRKLATPVGKMFLRIARVPSGSAFTHLVDSIINRHRIMYLLYATGTAFTSLYTHGDDSLTGLSSNNRPDFSAMQAIATTCGWTLKSDSCQWSDVASGLEFLGRYATGSFSKREEMRLIMLTLYPEYPIESLEISLVRAYAIIEDAGITSGRVLEIYQAFLKSHGLTEPPKGITLPEHHKQWSQKARYHM